MITTDAKTRDLGTATRFALIEAFLLTEGSFYTITAEDVWNLSHSQAVRVLNSFIQFNPSVTVRRESGSGRKRWLAHGSSFGLKAIQASVPPELYIHTYFQLHGLDTDVLQWSYDSYKKGVR